MREESDTPLGAVASLVSISLPTRSQTFSALASDVNASTKIAVKDGVRRDRGAEKESKGVAMALARCCVSMPL